MALSVVVAPGVVVAGVEPPSLHSTTVQLPMCLRAFEYGGLHRVLDYDVCERLSHYDNELINITLAFVPWEILLKQSGVLPLNDAVNFANATSAED